MPAILILFIWVIVILALAGAAIYLIRMVSSDAMLTKLATVVVVVVAAVFLLYLLIGVLPPWPGHHP